MHGSVRCHDREGAVCRAGGRSVPEAIRGTALPRCSVKDMRLFAAVLLSASALLAQGEDFSPDLLQAAQRGRDAQVKAFLDDGANIEAVDKDGRTPLMLAAQHGHAATVELLLGRGAKADARDRQGATAYVLALFSPAGNGKHQSLAIGVMVMEATKGFSRSRSV